MLIVFLEHDYLVFRLMKLSFSLVSIIALCLLAFVPDTSNGQQAELPIYEWVESLSVKRDFRSEKMRQVIRTIVALDSVDRCEALSLLDAHRREGNARYKIRQLVVLYAVSEYHFYCTPVRITDESLENALRSAYELEDDLLLYELHGMGASMYYSKQDYGRVILHGTLANESVQRGGRENFYMWSSYKFVLAYALYYAREYRQCIDESLQLVSPEFDRVMYNDSLQMDYAMNTWNMVGLCYSKLQQIDSAFIAFDKSLELAQDNPFWIALVNGNKGDLFYTLGQYDTAKVLLMKDYEQSMILGETGNAANSLQWVARIDIQRGQYGSAYKSILHAKRLVSHRYKPEFMANVLFALSTVYARLGKADSAEIILNQYLTLHDSIENVAANNRSAIVKMQLDNLANVHTIKELNKSKRRISLVRNFTMGFVILFALTGYLYMSRKQLRMKLRQQAALEAQGIAEREVAVAKEQLAIYTQHILEKSKLVDNLQVQLSELESTESQQDKISKLSRHVILTESDWANFKNLFEKVYPGFFTSLKDRVPDITLAEQRMAALVKLQLSIKESADLLGISTNSVHKNKQRLRMRLGLEQDEDLTTYFISESSDANKPIFNSLTAR